MSEQFGPIWRVVRRLFVMYDTNAPSAMRTPKELAARTRPLPNIPDGPAHKLSDNDYYKRDFRRNIYGFKMLAKGDVAKLLGEAEEKGLANLPPLPSSRQAVRVMRGRSTEEAYKEAYGGMNTPRSG
eukprot:Nk52_evm8s361 gene=Nk52_evmTU8s361